MLGKLLFFILLGLFLFVLWQKKRIAQIKNEEKRKKIIESQKMVQCPQCGVHFVEVDGGWFNGLMYCSQACADKAKESKS